MRSMDVAVSRAVKNHFFFVLLRAMGTPLYAPLDFLWSMIFPAVRSIFTKWPLRGFFTWTMSFFFAMESFRSLGVETKL